MFGLGLSNGVLFHSPEGSSLTCTRKEPGRAVHLCSLTANTNVSSSSRVWHTHTAHINTNLYISYVSLKPGENSIKAHLKTENKTTVKPTVHSTSQTVMIIVF